MKKHISLVLTVLLLFTCAIPAFAAGVSIKPRYAREEAVLTVTLPIAKSSSLATFLTTMEYDQSKLTLTNVKFQSGDMTVFKDDVPGEVKLSAIWQGAQKDAATLCTLTFNIKEGAEGTVTFHFKDTEATDENDKPLSVSFGKEKFLTFALTETIGGNVDIPKTAGTYIGVSIGAVALLAVAGVTAGILIKRKKNG